MSDIEYQIESDRWTALDKRYITQLLPTEYSINITNAFGGCQYNKQWIYVYEMDFWLNIHSVYEWVRWIVDWIFIPCTQGLGGCPIRYSFGICRGLADYWLNIQLVYAGVRQITDQILILHMWGLDGWLIRYLFIICWGLVNYWVNIQLVYERVRWITDWIFDPHM